MVVTTDAVLAVNWEAIISRTHPRSRDCSHKLTVSVISDGLERVICEECGHVSIRYESMISGDIRRSQFKRLARLVPEEH